LQTLSKTLTKKYLIRFIELVALIATIIAAVPIIQQYLFKDSNKLYVILDKYPLDGYTINKDKSNKTIFYDGLNFTLRLAKNDKTDDIIIDKISFLVTSLGDCNLSTVRVDSSKINGAGSNVHGSIDIALVQGEINSMFKYENIQTKNTGNIIYSSHDSKSTIFLTNNDRFINLSGFIRIRDKGKYKARLVFEYSYLNSKIKHIVKTENVYICK
jgi:hypothetical protein